MKGDTCEVERAERKRQIGPHAYGKGVPKQFSEDEIQRRKARLAEGRKARWDGWRRCLKKNKDYCRDGRLSRKPGVVGVQSSPGW